MTRERLNKIESLYHAALELKESEREDFLRDSCKGDAHLFAEILSLLSFEKQAEDFIESNALDIAAKSLTETRAENLIGKEFGTYKIESFIGAGGMGEVFCAVDERLGRKVALKLLSPMLSADAEYLRRFEREARAASALNHPNILTIFEIGSFENTSFIATEFIEGETLRRRIAAENLELPETIKISVQIAEALEAAHAAGIIHRDIKPENIMLRSDGYVKILDFGLAKTVRGSPHADKIAENFTTAAHTLPGMILGTPSYMSPEQVRGKTVDARSDIFSLGVIIYEMISRKRPFSGETTSDIIASILQSEPEPLADPDRQIPNEPERIVEKALSKDKKSRYQTMSEMLADLKILREQMQYETSLEKFTSGQYKSASGKRFVFPIFQNAKIMLAACALTLILISAFGYYFFADKTGKINSVAVMPFINSNSDGETEYLSDGLTESVIDRLSQFSNFKIMSFNSVARYKGNAYDAQNIGRELNVEAVLISRLTQNGDDITINTELVNAEDGSRIWGYQYGGKTKDILSMQESITREISERLNLTLSGAEKDFLDKSYTKNVEAYQLYLRGRFFWNKRSADGLRRAIEFFNQAIEKDPGYAIAFAGLADCYGLLSNYTDTPPQESMPKAKAAALKALEIDDGLAEAHTSLGNIKKEYDWDFAGAENSFRRAIELNPNYATAHQWRAENLVVLKRFDEAVRSMKRAQELDPFSIIINGEVGWVLHHARRYDEAIPQLKKTVELDPNFARTHFFLGRVYEQKQMFAEAIAETGKAIEISGGNTLFKASLAHIYASAKQKEEAERITQELKKRAESGYVSPFAFALVYTGLDQKEPALQYLEKAYQERDTILFNYIRDPQMDNIYKEPRFAELLRRVNLEP